jgi:hypothetical protein
MVRFQISTGKITADDGSTIGTGYAGAPGAVNDPSKCGLTDVGPLPPGIWAMGQPENDPKTGVFSIPLWMLAGDPMGRDCETPGNFRWHGDNAAKPPQSSSEGCLVSDHPSRLAGWSDPDHQLTVVP